MSRILMIGAGGVATVAAFKIVQNADVFTEFMIASRRKEKCDKLVEAMIERMKLSLVEKEERKEQTVYTLNTQHSTLNIFTAQVDADDVEQLKALFNDYKPELVINLALPYQDLTIM
ncbi:MAG: saccharopine dehydrogenase NADP-binding domain-containing protein, partial [Prevotella sp.]|nr:saccharopine dehydrogenase NADP-binding domain-containing protein [Prevotella sp.]